MVRHGRAVRQGNSRGRNPVSRPALWALAAAAWVPMSCGQPATESEAIGNNQAALDTSEFELLRAQELPSPRSSDEVLPLITAPAKRTRTIAGLLLNIGGGNPDVTKMTDLLMGPGASLRHMYNEISYGIQDIQVDFIGPNMLPQPTCLPAVCCGPKANQPNGPEVMAIIAGLPKTYDHYFWIYGTPLPAGASCGTWGDEGSANMPAVYSSYSFQSLVGMSQELGHNFGMTHEPTLTCTGGATFLDDSTQCTHHEYGSQLSFMGGGAHHPSAYQKFEEGWISGCNVVKAGGSDTFTLVPQELPCGGVQLLQIKAPKVRPAPAAGDRQGQGPMLGFYYLEMRTPIGFDVANGNPALKPMVVVSIGADLPTPTRASQYLYVLDQVPSTASLNDAGLNTVGQSYVDPGGGLTITLTAIDARSATVTVTTTGTGGHVCADNTAFTGPGPDATSCGPLVGAGDAGTPIIVPGSDAGPVTRDAGNPVPRDAGRGGGAVADAAADSGRGGSGGTGGATGSGGAVGTGGTPGTGGAVTTGSGGAPATGGAGGGPASGGSIITAGNAGEAGSGAGPVSGGCSCSTLGSQAKVPYRLVGPWALALALGLTRLKRAKSRRPRAAQ